MLPRNQRQEALSRAYVRAVAAQAGVICSEPEYDFGIDLCLRAVAVRGHRHFDVSGQVDLQVKSTTRAGVTKTGIVYDLEVQNYGDLREEGYNCPRLLVVFVMPEDEGRWLTQSPEELILRHCAYWVSLAGSPTTTSTTTVRVTIPPANIFTAETVRSVMDALRERRRL
jgi:hypothetical protein